MRFLWERHRDETNGGYSWGVDGEHATVSVKQAYGHAFVLLAASSPAVNAELMKYVKKVMGNSGI
jgi:sulfoquinovose isomerase